MNRTVAWLALVLLAGPVAAQQPGPEPSQPAVAPVHRPVVTADLRPEYLAGEPILVRFEVANKTTTDVRFADLSARPWLVRFELTGPDGKTLSRFNTPPELDLPRAWELGPRGRRQVLLQIPSSAGLAPGDWQVKVRILDDQGDVSLPTHSFSVARPKPVGGALVNDPLGTDRSGHQAVWVHQAASGYDLYLHHSQGKRPEKTLGDYHLAHLDQRVDPVLTHSRPQERWGRYVYWQRDGRTLQYAQLDGQQLRGKVRTLQVPWPEVELLARGGTDADGGLHVPLWVPAPKGTGGEIRVASIRGQGKARFRSVVRLPRPPAWVESTVDASGTLRLLISHDGFLDLYAVAPGNDLPAVGKRLPVELAPQAARFGYLPDQDDAPGGLAILGLNVTPEGLIGQWLTLGGQPGHRYAPLAPPAGASLLDLLPRGLQPYAAAYQPPEGPAVLLRPGKPAKTLQGRADGVLLSDGADAVLLRELTGGQAPLRTRRLIDGSD